MIKRRFLVLCASLVFGSLLSGSLAFAEEAENFPLRKAFPEIKVIETADLTQKAGDYTVVDVRSPFEYSIMHIQGALSLPISDRKFVENAKQAAADTKKPLVFYCNGHRCAKSYEAAMLMTKAGATNVLSYDGGISDWATSNPQLTLLLDKPLDPKALINDAKFKSYTLSPKDFMSKAQAQPTAYVIDVRDSFQVEGVSLFPGRDYRTGLDIAKLKKVINAAKEGNQPMYFYDATGLQVKPLQYLLEDQGVKEYYFLQGGIAGYFDMLSGKTK
ncbi:MAG: rhodanese-like domain-containing protein [Halothiobacillaceae bacterium]|nr:rhodanese-like domain-containing protein [Halothiobacillaceae bacterium]